MTIHREQTVTSTVHCRANALGCELAVTFVSQAICWIVPGDLPELPAVLQHPRWCGTLRLPPTTWRRVRAKYHLGQHVRLQTYTRHCRGRMVVTGASMNRDGEVLLVLAGAGPCRLVFPNSMTITHARGRWHVAEAT